MSYRTKKEALMISVVLIWLAFWSSVSAHEGEFSARVYPIGAAPILVEDFTMNGKVNLHAEWRGSFITLSFDEIKTIQYLNPGSPTYDAEVTFNSGRKDNFVLMPGVFHGRSEFGEWSMHAERAARIVFDPSAVTEIGEGAEYSNFDHVLLSNGDTIIGRVQTKVFKIRTSYATLDFETPQIGYIDFQRGRQERDILGLRLGDKLSGVVEAPSIRLLMRSGAEVKLDKRKINSIIFVLVRN